MRLFDLFIIIQILIVSTKTTDSLGLHSFTGLRTQVHRTAGSGQNGVLYENRQVVLHHITYRFCIAVR